MKTNINKLAKAYGFVNNVENYGLECFWGMPEVDEKSGDFCFTVLREIRVNERFNVLRVNLFSKSNIPDKYSVSLVGEESDDSEEIRIILSEIVEYLEISINYMDKEYFDLCNELLATCLNFIGYVTTTEILEGGNLAYRYA